MRSGELLVVGNVWTVGAIASASWGWALFCAAAAGMFFLLSYMTE